MLQQTQVSRVIPYYRAFLKRFPTLPVLAQANLSDVLSLWQGLGYNRRARFLHQAARMIEITYQNRFPETAEELEHIPGVGAYTARAICAFAYNQPTVFLETNIRTVFLHHFFSRGKAISDRRLLVVAGELVDTSSPREWYWALMDYGAYLKSQGVRNTSSKHYTRQSRFEGSSRQVRGAVLRAALQGPATLGALSKRIDVKTSPEKLRYTLETLLAEGLIVKRATRYAVAD